MKSKIILGVVAAAATFTAGAALAQPYGYESRGGYDHRYVRDSDRDGIPDRAEWGRDRDRDGRPDQWDRYDNRRDYRYRHHDQRWDGRDYRYSHPYYGYDYRR